MYVQPSLCPYMNCDLAISFLLLHFILKCECIQDSVFKLCKDLECIVFDCVLCAVCVLCLSVLATVCPFKEVTREEVLTREVKKEEERK